MTRNAGQSLLSAALTDVESYLTRYVVFPTVDYALVGALYAAGTYLWPDFDAYGYLVITADVKRSGKSRFAEVLSNVSSNPRNFAGMTPATLFRSIKDENPTVFIDEAETMSSEAADVMRAVLNVGYRKGQTIPRMGKTGVVEWPVYCPKVFILIGDVNDTLRDRSIVIRMQRGTPRERFLYEVAKADGHALGVKLLELLSERKDQVMQSYMNTRLPFLGDRDEELWLPLFAVCSVLAPHRIPELERIAVDMSTEKTMPKRKFTTLAGAEEEAMDEEYAVRLLRDLCKVIDGNKHIFTQDALEKLKALATSPWRKFRGEGLDAHDMGNLLSRFGIQPRLVRGPGGAKGKVARGYRKEDAAAALKKLSGT